MHIIKNAATTNNPTHANDVETWCGAIATRDMYARRRASPSNQINTIVGDERYNNYDYLHSSS